MSKLSRDLRDEVLKAMDEKKMNWSELARELNLKRNSLWRSVIYQKSISTRKMEKICEVLEIEIKFVRKDEG